MDSTKSSQLIRDPRGAVTQELHQLRTSDNGRARDKIAVVQATLLEAWRADVDLAACADKVLDELLQRREALLVNGIRVSLLRQSNTVCAQEDQSLFVRRHGSVGNDESDRCSVRVRCGTGEAHTESSGHIWIPPSCAVIWPSRGDG